MITSVLFAPIIGDFYGSATVPVAPVAVPPTESLVPN
jgi:hypothetical protein